MGLRAGNLVSSNKSRPGDVQRKQLFYFWAWAGCDLQQHWTFVGALWPFQTSVLMCRGCSFSSSGGVGTESGTVHNEGTVHLFALCTYALWGLAGSDPGPTAVPPRPPPRPRLGLHGRRHPPRDGGRPDPGGRGGPCAACGGGGGARRWPPTAGVCACPVLCACARVCVAEVGHMGA